MKNIIKVLMCFAFLICVVCFMVIGVGSNSNVTEFSRPMEIEITEPTTIDLEFEIEVEPETTEATEPTTMPEPTVATTEATEPEPVFELSDYERWVACCMVAGEAGAEPYDGKWAVAQCIYQACVREGMTPSEVRVAYQYSGWNESIQYNHPELWAEIEEVVSRVFDYGELYVDDEILYFYAPKYVYSSWHESMRFVCEVANHRFFGRR